MKILGVDSDKKYRDLYSGWLGADHDVTTVANGQKALESTDNSYDIVLVGRELPGLGGPELAARLDDQGLDCHLVMVGAEVASFDILEYPIDGYEQKPLDGPDLDRILDQYETRESYQTALEEYFRITSKLGALEAEHSQEKLERDDRYHRLRKRAEEKRAEVDDAITEANTDWDVAFKTCARPPQADAAHQL